MMKLAILVAFDVLVTTGGYRMVSMSLNTFGVQLEPNGDRFPAAR